MEERLELHAILKGRVQGVCCRAFVLEYAQEMGLVGCVRNLPDKSVEIYAQGPREQLEQFLLRVENKPGYGHVEAVQADFSPCRHAYANFLIVD